MHPKYSYFDCHLDHISSSASSLTRRKKEKRKKKKIENKISYRCKTNFFVLFVVVFKAKKNTYAIYNFYMSKNNLMDVGYHTKTSKFIWLEIHHQINLTDLSFIWLEFSTTFGKYIERWTEWSQNSFRGGKRTEFRTSEWSFIWLGRTHWPSEPYKKSLGRPKLCPFATSKFLQLITILVRINK